MFLKKILSRYLDMYVEYFQRVCLEGTVSVGTAF